ncbi:acetyl-CoA synthetase-like protein [Hypoxylon sp. EC38]|nr:acetyl-CoA synthetase-like protein [Hypoxylon sp. EC38]
MDQTFSLTDRDKAQIYMWNKDPPSRTQYCVDTLIHERCLSQPTAPAVCAWDGEFSYMELEHLSSALAQHLMTLGVGPEVFVPLCFEKSRWTIVAMLAVTKAGGAFVLLDPSHPKARLLSICQSVSATVIVALSECSKLAANLVATVVDIGDEKSEWFADKCPWVPSSATPENALYAVFTSGSTGTPKGVVSEHSSFSAAIHPYTQAVGLDHESRVFQFASYAFDVTIFDTFMTLINGGCVCVPSNNDRWSDIAKAIHHFRVTHSSLTPTVARILDPQDLPTLRTIVLGGEKLSPTDTAKWASHVRVVNLYGASECSIMSIQSTTGDSSPLQTTDHTTGSSSWIVDPNDHDKLLPVGVVGELLVEGPIVGRGYIDNLEKTATTFIQPPTWLREFRGNGYCQKVYKSGDLAQYDANGSVQFVGRKDTQVKLRGQRIELSEVEHNIRLAFPSASDVVVEVVTMPDSSRPPTLVAFIRNGDNVDTESRDSKAISGKIIVEPTDWLRSQVAILQSHLQQSLPSYMVPAVFLPLSTLPLTSTHKTNRKLLRELVTTLSREGLEKYQPKTGVNRVPLTTMEKLLQQYFARVLNLPVEHIGADDHFFRRGGDSLMAMKLVAMARKGRHNLTVQDVFEHPQLSTLASVIRCGTGDDDEEEEPLPEPFLLVGKQRDVVRAAAQQCHLPARAIEDIYPCTPLQRGFISETLRDPKAFIADIAIPLSPEINVQRLQEAWTAVANVNPTLRTRIVLSPSHGLLQVVVRENIRWVVSKSEEPRSLAAGIGTHLLQLRLCYEQEGNQNQPQLFLTIHHAVYDGWTLPLIFGEVEAAYHGNTLVPRPVSPFIRYLQSIPSSEAYWTSMMDNLQSPIFPSLPSITYQPSPSALMNTTITTPGSSAREFTLNTYVRLAWAVTQAQQQKTNDVFFGIVVSGRNAPVANIESMTIPTVATIPCRVTLDLQNSVRMALHKAQSDTIKGIPFEQTGLSDIRRLGENTALACSFQTLLVVQPAITPRSYSWMEESKSATDYRADATYAINMICGMEGDELKVITLYDPNVVKDSEMQRILSNFSHVLRKIYGSPDSLIRDILNFST